MEKGTFSARLRHIRTSLGIGQTEFAQNLDIPRTSLINYEKGISAPSLGLLSILKRIYGVDIDWFLTGEGQPFMRQTLVAEPPVAVLGYTPSSQRTAGAAGGVQLADEGSIGVAKSYRVPLLKQRVSCGPGMEWETEDNIEDFIEIDTFIPHLGLGRVFATKAHGSSMRGADIKEGDFLFFDASADFRPVDGIYIFALDGEVTCKRLEFDKLTKRLYVYSVRHADLDKAELVVSLDTNDPSFADRFCVFGRVIRCIRLIDIVEKLG